MPEKTRIKFNPATKEIEIEGSEAFVKKYFDVVSDVILGSRAGAGKTSKAAPSKPNKKAQKGNGATNTSSVLGLIKENKGGLTTPELKKKTGLADKQIWPIIYKAEKQGKIKKGGRGLYVAV